MPTDMPNLIKPPNHIKEKIGSGGLDSRVLERAQQAIDNNTIDFRPIAQELINDLSSALEAARSGALKGEAAIEAMIYPAMQIKAQGTMLHYMLATDVSDILVNFLENIKDTNDDLLEIVEAHKKTLTLIIVKEIKSSTGPVADQFKKALSDACTRYNKAYKVS